MTETEDLLTLKDDMVAFIEGHGLFRFKGYIGEDIASIAWDDEENPDSWKDFVEAAKAAGAVFLTMSDAALEADDLDALLEQLHDIEFPDNESMEIDEAEELRRYVGKMGYVQLGFAHGGVMFMHETSTDWYDRFQGLVEMVEALGEFMVQDGDGDSDN